MQIQTQDRLRNMPTFPRAETATIVLQPFIFESTKPQALLLFGVELECALKNLFSTWHSKSSEHNHSPMSPIYKALCSFHTVLLDLSAVDMLTVESKDNQGENRRGNMGLRQAYLIFGVPQTAPQIWVLAWAAQT